MPGGSNINDPRAHPDWLVNGQWAGTQTPTGYIRYGVLFDNLRVQYAKDASQVVAWLRVRRSDMDAFRMEMLGYTTWRRGATYLDRYIPVYCPYDRNLRCESLQLVKKGLDTYRTSLAASAPLFEKWIDFDWVVFEAVFKRPPFVIIADDATMPFGSTARSELSRYVSVRRQYSVRERRVPGLQFEVVGQLFGGLTSPQVIPEPGFIPDVTQTFWLTWHQIPIEAFADRRVALCLNTVNSSDFPIPLGNVGIPDTDPPVAPNPSTAKVFMAPANSLLFRGLAQPLEPYAGADGNLYFDPTFVFDYRPTVAFADAGSVDANGDYAAGVNVWGWQGYRLNSGVYRRLRYKQAGSPTDPGIPPYPKTDHKTLFVPGNVFT